MKLKKRCPICAGAVRWCRHGEHSCHYIECRTCKTSFNLERAVDQSYCDGPLEELQKAIGMAWNGMAARTALEAAGVQT